MTDRNAENELWYDPQTEKFENRRLFDLFEEILTRLEKLENINRMKEELENRRMSIPSCTEPTEQQIQNYMKNNNENYYNARERLREASYGGKPPGGYSSLGDYWKSF